MYESGEAQGLQLYSEGSIEVQIQMAHFHQPEIQGNAVQKFAALPQ